MMKKIYSVLLLVVLLFSMTAPAFAQITFEGEAPAVAEPPASTGITFEDQTTVAEPPASNGITMNFKIDTSPATEEELANARMMLTNLNMAIEQFDAAEVYTMLSELVNVGDLFADMWKPDMLAEFKQAIFVDLKSQIGNLENSTFFEDQFRKEWNDPAVRAEAAKSGLIEYLSETSIRVMGSIDASVSGNVITYSDINGNSLYTITYANGEKENSLMIIVDVPNEKEPIHVEMMLEILDDTLMFYGRENASGEFTAGSEISFPETNVILISDLETKHEARLTFDPENYTIALTSDEFVDDEGETVDAVDISVELNPENKSISLNSRGDEVVSIYFYAEEKSITLAGSAMAAADPTGMATGASSFSLAFDEETTAIDVSAGENSLAKLTFNKATNSIVVGVDMMGSGTLTDLINITVNKDAHSLTVSMMGMEIFNAAVDSAAETVTIKSMDQETMEPSEEVMTLEDIAISFRPVEITE